MTPGFFLASAGALRETQARRYVRCARDLVLFHECTVFSSRQNLVNTTCQQHEWSLWEGSGIKNWQSPPSFGKVRHTWRPSPLTMIRFSAVAKWTDTHI